MEMYGIIGGIIFVIVVLFITKYNQLVGVKNTVENAFSDMDVQMKMRFDLVENLVETVKGYATHEKETLTQLTAARSQWMNATSAEDKTKADGQLAGALKTLFANSENYPELKANTGFLHLQEKLSDIETQIANSRRYYNASIREFNNAIMKFPSNIVAKIAGFKNMNEYFQISEEEKKTPKVKF